MKKWTLIIDVEKCENCNNCFLADKDEYCGNRFPGYSEPQPHHGHRWIDIKRRERGSGSLMDVAYLPTMCNQCEDAPCIKAATNGEVFRRDDGIVMIDPVKAKGQKRLVKSCPYGHIWWNDELQLPQKWFFDAHLLDAGWKEPRCAQSCATGAIRAEQLDEDELAYRVRSEELEVLHPEHGTKPRIWYKNLYRFSKDHISGSVVADNGDVVDCVTDARVVLEKDGDVIAIQHTNYFGDFKFDKLAADSGAYLVKIYSDDYHKSIEVELKQSVNLGVINVS